MAFQFYTIMSHVSILNSALKFKSLKILLIKIESDIAVFFTWLMQTYSTNLIVNENHL